MRARVVYESMFDNTAQTADAVARGLRAVLEGERPHVVLEAVAAR